MRKIDCGGGIPFILDAGNPFAEHVRIAHSNLLKQQREEGFLHAGGLYFDDDAEFGILQAADVVAWGVRRTASGLMLPPGMESIGELFKNGHNKADFKAEWIQQLKDNVDKELRKFREEKYGI